MCVCMMHVIGMCVLLSVCLSQSLSVSLPPSLALSLCYSICLCLSYACMDTCIHVANIWANDTSLNKSFSCSPLTAPSSQRPMTVTQPSPPNQLNCIRGNTQTAPEELHEFSTKLQLQRGDVRM